MARIALPLLLLVSVGANFAAADSCSSNTLNVSYPAPVAANGWQYRLIANGFTMPRSIVFDGDGGLLVLDAGVGLKHVTLNDEGGTCLSVSNSTTLITDANLNHGLALSNDGETVYVSSSSSVFSFAYDSKAISVDISSNTTLVVNMSDTDYTTRTLLMSSKQAGTLLVSRGSSANVDESAFNLTSGHSQIRSYDVNVNVNVTGTGTDQGRNGPYDFLDGHVIGWGLRNSVGVAENPVSGDIWSVENSVDQLTRQGQDIHEDNPAEELNYHGVLGSNVSQGGNYGYPVCYTIWSTDGFPDLGSLEIGDQFPADGSPSNLTDQDCNTEFVDPRIPFQAHTAPLDIKFNANASEAFISFHGSWDSTNNVGYRIASLAFDSDGQPIAQQNSTDATTDVLTNANLENCPDECFRPVGLAWDAKGRLWFSSDATGEIFVLEQVNSSGTSNGDKSLDNGSGAALFPERSAVVAVVLATVLAGLLLA